MSTLVTAPADNVIQLPRRASASIAAGRLADADLDRWANRLARLLLGRGASAGDRIALAVDPRVEAVVADAAVRKIGAVPVRVEEQSDTGFGITTRSRRAELSDTVDWLVLDDRSTLRRYLVSSDAPLSGTDLRAVS
ncbi:AMP-binding protein [Nocardia caishijiensis]|uniref:AMP-binding enzyme n=1 Tax=Nocardia caishijiensis TaxID=184756 RepID=A0ABQ6YL94_9NOCA|nr:AMP-binding protein [Nocardia caishijiensis]KAF0846567.1 AMP-binding enzyme [Nocardia caishijiensis]